MFALNLVSDLRFFYRDRSEFLVKSIFTLPLHNSLRIVGARNV